ncbi:MAG: hypothetical protein MN733_23380 [Nitrososphaera sp.]|nr:hypothetical protein [Nitrososphaera sp.]
MNAIAIILLMRMLTTTAVSGGPESPKPYVTKACYRTVSIFQPSILNHLTFAEIARLQALRPRNTKKV